MSDPVNNAVNSISDSLSTEGFFDFDVTRGDLRDISQVLAGLEPEQRNEVISQLDDSQLENWAGEIHGTWGDLPADERQQLFADLAQGLDAEQMVRMVNAFDAKGQYDSIRELGTAVATHGSPDSKVAFVDAMAERTVEGRDSYNPDPTHRHDVTDRVNADPDAQAVAEVLGSLQGSHFDEAVGHLSETQLKAVMQAGIHETEVNSRNGSITNFDTTVAAQIVEAAATSNDPAVQALVFDAAADKLGDIQGGGDQGAVPGGIGVDSRLAPARDTLSSAMTTLINADTTGIVQHLETTDRYGDSLTTYLQEQLANGREEQVGELILKLQSGNDLSEDPVARFEAEDAGGNRNNAQVLGYFGGSMEAAVRNVTSDRVAQAEMIGEIFGSVVTVAGIAGKAGGSATTVGTNAATYLSQEFIDDRVADIKAEGSNLRDELNQLVYPHDADGIPYEGERSESAFDSAHSRVVLHHGF